MLAFVSNLIFVQILLIACSSKSDMSVHYVADANTKSSEKKSQKAKTELAIKEYNKPERILLNPEKTYSLSIFFESESAKSFIVKKLANDSVVFKGSTNLSVDWEDDEHIKIGEPVGTIEAENNNQGNGYLINIITGKKIWRN